MNIYTLYFQSKNTSIIENKITFKYRFDAVRSQIDPLACPSVAEEAVAGELVPGVEGEVWCGGRQRLVFLEDHARAGLPNGKCCSDLPDHFMARTICKRNRFFFRECANSAV